MGFAPVARHRSRGVLLYRQGGINVIVNGRMPSLPGILPKGRSLASPGPAASCFYVQLIEPEASVLDVEGEEGLQRIGLGCADVLKVASSLNKRGVAFVESRGVHSDALAALVTKLHSLGYRGDYSFEVFNDDYQQMPLPAVAARAFKSALWLGEDVLRRSVPLPNQIRLKA